MTLTFIIGIEYLNYFFPVINFVQRTHRSQFLIQDDGTGLTIFSKASSTPCQVFLNFFLPSFFQVCQNMIYGVRKYTTNCAGYFFARFRRNNCDFWVIILPHRKRNCYDPINEYALFWGFRSATSLETVDRRIYLVFRPGNKQTGTRLPPK